MPICGGQLKCSGKANKNDATALPRIQDGGRSTGTKRDQHRKPPGRLVPFLIPRELSSPCPSLPLYSPFLFSARQMAKAGLSRSRLYISGRRRGFCGRTSTRGNFASGVMEGSHQSPLFSRHCRLCLLLFPGFVDVVAVDAGTQPGTARITFGWDAEIPLST